MNPMITKTLIKIILPWALKWVPKLFTNIKFFNMKKSAKDVMKVYFIKFINLFEEVAKGLDDGNLSLIEIAGLADNVIGLVSVFGDWDEIGEAWNLIYKNSEPARLELITELKAELDIPNDALELIIEKGFKALEANYDFGKSIKDYVQSK